MQKERTDVDYEKNKIVKEKDQHRDDAKEQLNLRITKEK